MWASYWSVSPNGTAEMPPSVPFSKWMKKQGDPPKFWKGHWGKFFSNKPEEGCRTGIPRITLPDEFWNDYARLYPSGHKEDPTPKAVCAPGLRWEEGKHGYFSFKGAVYFRHPNGITYEATGVDSFPPYQY